jgi:hypothetical protein
MLVRIRPEAPSPSSPRLRPVLMSSPRGGADGEGGKNGGGQRPAALNSDVSRFNPVQDTSIARDGGVGSGSYRTPNLGMELPLLLQSPLGSLVLRMLALGSRGVVAERRAGSERHRGDKLLQQVPPDQTREHPHRSEENLSAREPLLTNRAEFAIGHNHMHNGAVSSSRHPCCTPNDQELSR